MWKVQHRLATTGADYRTLRTPQLAPAHRDHAVVKNHLMRWSAAANLRECQVPAVGLLESSAPIHFVENLQREQLLDAWSVLGVFPGNEPTRTLMKP